MINWPFFTVLLSGWLYIDAAYRGPKCLYYLFHLITTCLLLILMKYTSPHYISQYLIIIGLLIMIFADTWQTFSSKYTDISIFLLMFSFLLYSISFAVQIKFIFFWQILILILVISIVSILLLNQYKRDISIYKISLFFASLLMLYTAIVKYLFILEKHSFYIMLGVLLFFIANIINIITNFVCKTKNIISLIVAFDLFGKLCFIYTMY